MIVDQLQNLMLVTMAMLVQVVCCVLVTRSKLSKVMDPTVILSAMRNQRNQMMTTLNVVTIRIISSYLEDNFVGYKMYHCFHKIEVRESVNLNLFCESLCFSVIFLNVDSWQVCVSWQNLVQVSTLPHTTSWLVCWIFFSVCVPGNNLLADGSCSKGRKSELFDLQKINMEIVSDDIISLPVRNKMSNTDRTNQICTNLENIKWTIW